MKEDNLTTITKRPEANKRLAGQVFMYPERDSNSHAQGAEDFESSVSAYSTIRAMPLTSYTPAAKRRGRYIFL